MHPRLTHIIICKRNNSCTIAREPGPAGRTDTQRVVCKFTREVDCKNLHYTLSLECVDMFSSHPISCFSGTTKPNTTIPKPPTRLLLLGYYTPQNSAHLPQLLSPLSSLLNQPPSQCFLQDVFRARRGRGRPRQPLLLLQRRTPQECARRGIATTRAVVIISTAISCPFHTTLSIGAVLNSGRKHLWRLAINQQYKTPLGRHYRSLSLYGQYKGNCGGNLVHNKTTRRTSLL